MYGRGKVFVKKGNFKKAESDFLEALSIHKKMGERLGRAMTYNKLGSLYIETNQLQKAKDILKKGLKFSNEFNTVIKKIKFNFIL